jgi:FkbM family methyltransferase
MAPSKLLDILGPTHGLRELHKTLRPRTAAAKLRTRVDWLRFARRVPVEPWSGLVRLGSAYGGYVVPLDIVGSDWICYSGGLGEDVSFELALIDATGCRVYGFDPIPRAAAYAEGVAAENPRFEFMPVGLWSTDTTARFYAPAHPDHVSHSIANLQLTDSFVTARCRSLPSLMSELGHGTIDLLKLDVEGAEYDVLEPLFARELEVRLLCIDFHKIRSIGHMAETVQRLVDLGYRVVHVHRTDVTFVRR